jgi:hypothetical protein
MKKQSNPEIEKIKKEVDKLFDKFIEEGKIIIKGK